METYMDDYFHMSLWDISICFSFKITSLL